MTPAIDINNAESIAAALAQMTSKVPEQPVADEATEPKSESELTRNIRLLEITNKELMEGVSADIDINLPQIPADASDEEKLEILEEINKKLGEQNKKGKQEKEQGKKEEEV